MKFKIIYFIILALFIVGCAPQEEVDVFSKDLIIYAEGDVQDKVTNDFNLVVKVENIEIKWESSDTSVILVINDRAIVSRKDKDSFITLTASYGEGENLKTKDFLIVVKGKEKINPPIDDIAPVFSGRSSVDVEINSEIDLLSFVQAVDAVDGPVEVIIKSSDLDVTKKGTYTVVYEASDLAGNVATFTLTIKVIEKQEKVTYKEDFSKLNLPNPTYSKGTFVGNHGIIWEYSGSRGDQTLDGTAITFGGKTDDYSSLKTSLKDGISYFSVDLKKAFTSSNLRKIALIINDDIIDEFVLDDENTGVQVFEVELNVFGDYTIEIAQVDTSTSRAQVTLDNIIIINNPESNLSIEEQNLNDDFDNLEIPSIFIETGNITLPKIGSFGSTITWKYTNANDQNNSLINLNTGAISVPSSGIVSVKLDAILTNGDYQLTKTFTIKIGEGDPIAISELFKTVNEQKVKIKGIVTNIFETSTGKRFFIQDNTNGVMVYLPNTYTVAIGDEIEIIAKKLSIKGIVYLDDISKLTKISTNNIVNAINLANQNLDTLIGKVVNLNGLLKFTYGNVNNFTLVNEYREIDVYFDESIINIDALKAKIIGVQVAKEVDLFGVVYFEGNNYKVYATNQNDIEVASTLDFDRIDEVIHSHITFPQNGATLTRNIQLVTEDDLFIDLEIHYTSSNTNVLTNQGVVTRLDSDTNVVLTYEIFIDGTLIATHNVNLVVEQKSAFTGYYASLQGLSGEALKIELKSIISKMKSISYKETSYVLEDSDIDLTKTGQLLLIYSRTNAKNVWDGASSWNKEHIWPQSKLGSASKSDIHNLRASNTSVNSSRGNLPYVDGSGTYKRTNGGWYPGDDDRGDIARIVLYMNIRWGLEIRPGDSGIGELSMFIKWHQLDPVDDFEIHRNQVIYEHQQNRNPFIDHPELVEMIYGSTKSVNITNEEPVNTYYISFLSVYGTDILNRRIIQF